ncbi:MAG: tetratricopeptide repeat protein [bacterium]
MARNAYTPASEAEKMEITNLRRFTPQQQVAKLLDYVEAECPPANQGEKSDLTIFQLIWQKVKALISSSSPRIMTILWPEKPAWRFGYAVVALFVIAGGTFLGVQFYRTGYRIYKAKQILLDQYKVFIAETARLSGGYASTGSSVLLGPSDTSTVEPSYLETARTRLESAFASGSQSVKGKQLLAQIFIIERNYAKADSVLRQIDAEVRKSPAILNDLGVLCFAQRDWAVAVEYFAAAVAADPGFPEARYNLALAKAKMGATAEAISILNDFLNVETNSRWKDAARDFLERLKQKEL